MEKKGGDLHGVSKQQSLTRNLQKEARAKPREHDCIKLHIDREKEGLLKKSETILGTDLEAGYRTENVSEAGKIKRPSEATGTRSRS